jgi:hypothetical protein
MDAGRLRRVAQRTRNGASGLPFTKSDAEPLAIAFCLAIAFLIATLAYLISRITDD